MVGQEPGKGLRLLGVTACPTGIAHTYMAAEKLEQAARELGHEMRVETQGSIGVEHELTDAEIAAADGVVVAADKDVDLSRFAGKRVLVTGVSEGISRPERLIEEVLAAPVHGGSGVAGPALGSRGRERSAVYKSLMNGVSYMIPFVVVGGLLIAVSLAIGGTPRPSGGLVIPPGSFWQHVNDIGTIGFTLMVPVLSGYIAYAIGDRPALVPGMIGGWIANTGALYGSKAGAGFIGAIVTGFLAGYLVLGIKRVRVPGFVQPIMPIIVIPIVSTAALGLFFIYVVGRPIAWVFAQLTGWLSGMTGTSAVVLGVIVGLMIAFDMGGPVNKTAFLFGAGLIASGNTEVMGLCAAAIPVPPLGVGLATLLRRRMFDRQEREAGLAALFMGFFGITEGAIPFAAARPLRVIPANMLGGAVAAGLAGAFGAKDAVPHGGPIVAVLGAVDGVPMFLLAVVCGTAVTAGSMLVLLSMGGDGGGGGKARPAEVPAPREPVAEPPAAAGPEPVPVPAAEPEVLSGCLTGATVRLSLASAGKGEAIEELAALLGRSGRVADPAALVRAALDREAQGTTGLGDGVAVPHAKSDAVREPVVGFARSARGIAWGAADGSPARLVFMIAVPGSAAGNEHLLILARLSRKLVDPRFRQRLLEADDVPGVLEVLAEVE